MFKVVLVVGIFVDVKWYPTMVLICVSLMVMVSVFHGPVDHFCISFLNHFKFLSQFAFCCCGKHQDESNLREKGLF